MSTDRPSDAAIFAAVASMMRDSVIPAMSGGVPDAHTRSVVVQLIGLVEYASSRPAAPAAGRRQELVDALDRLADNPIVASRWPGEPFAVAAAALVECVTRDDHAADEVRAGLRSVLVAHLDDELRSTAPLIDAYRGRLRDE